MGLLNYTTKITTAATLGEINSILVASGASQVLMEYDGAKNVTAVSFRAKTSFGDIAFKLPCDVAAATLILNKQVQLKQIPKRYLNDTEQARRIAWRIIKDWLEAQMALISMGMAKLEQVFLPYAQDAQGQTVYESIRDRKFEAIALTNGDAK